jgi:hypothetical protein
MLSSLLERWRTLPPLAFGLLTSGCTSCDCPPSSSTVFRVEAARFEELQARYGPDGVPTELCRELCRVGEPEGGGDASDDAIDDCTLTTLADAGGAVRCTSTDCEATP